MSKTREVINISETIIMIEGVHYSKISPEIKIIGELVQIVDRLTRKLECKDIVRLEIASIINHQIFIMSDIVLTLAGPNLPGLFVLLDQNSKPIADAVFSNQAVGANTNPAAAIFAIDPDNPNAPTRTALALGTGQQTFTADATYTDPADNVKKSGSFSVVKNYSVVAATVGLDVVFP